MPHVQIQLAKHDSKGVPTGEFHDEVNGIDSEVAAAWVRDGKCRIVPSKPEKAPAKAEKAPAKAPAKAKKLPSVATTTT